ncbi:hypothetical protein Acsp03_71910 [Actinomadura sp. NBRC 104412]|nr:hypothetical protein Acsp03_71910 [Actinomadura sp. NBRC 104412]
MRRLVARFLDAEAVKADKIAYSVDLMTEEGAATAMSLHRAACALRNAALALYDPRRVRACALSDVDRRSMKMIILRLLRRPVIEYLHLACEETYRLAGRRPRDDFGGRVLRSEASAYDDAISALMAGSPSQW